MDILIRIFLGLVLSLFGIMFIAPLVTGGDYRDEPTTNAEAPEPKE